MGKVIKMCSPSVSNEIFRLHILGIAALIVSSHELKSFSKISIREENGDLKQVLNILSETQQKLNRVILP